MVPEASAYGTKWYQVAVKPWEDLSFAYGKQVVFVIFFFKSQKIPFQNLIY